MHCDVQVKINTINTNKYNKFKYNTDAGQNNCSKIFAVKKQYLLRGQKIIRSKNDICCKKIG